MIGHISGAIVAIRKDRAIIDAGGIGYIIFTTPETLAALTEGERAEFLTHLAVRENSLDLYGFLREEELSMFEMLISVSGIGPKSALGVLSIAGFQDVGRAISEGNSAYLTKVSGIGKKTAERIVMELKDKVLHDGKMHGVLKNSEDALEALVAMGYSLGEAREAMKNVPEKTTDSGERLKEALKVLWGARSL